MSDRIIIFDTTLRDGEQAPGASMTIDEKLRIAHQLARLNVDVLEAGFPVSSPAQFEAVQRIASEVEGPVICALARAREEDIRAAAEALKPGRRTRIHTFIATSDIHIDAKFGDARYGRTLQEKRRTILRLAEEAVRLARTFTDDVEFSAEDAGRTDVGYLAEVVQVAIEAGATTINLPDTTGYCVPDEYAAMFREVIRRVQPPPHVIFSAHCHDDLGMAVANSLAAVQAGVRQIECTINGIGERAGNAALEEIVMALKVRGERFGRLQVHIVTQYLTETSRMVSMAPAFRCRPTRPSSAATPSAMRPGFTSTACCGDATPTKSCVPKTWASSPNRSGSDAIRGGTDCSTGWPDWASQSRKPAKRKSTGVSWRWPT